MCSGGSIHYDDQTVDAEMFYHQESTMMGKDYNVSVVVVLVVKA